MTGKDRGNVLENENRVESGMSPHSVTEAYTVYKLPVYAANSPPDISVPEGTSHVWVKDPIPRDNCRESSLPPSMSNNCGRRRERLVPAQVPIEDLHFCHDRMTPVHLGYDKTLVGSLCFVCDSDTP